MSLKIGRFPLQQLDLWFDKLTILSEGEGSNSFVPDESGTGEYWVVS
jgi:hypothetical protein